MRTIAHISDLHFGKSARHIEEALFLDLKKMKPSLITVSGDLTQRAERKQFSRARAFIARLPAPTVVVPGNHDIPLYNFPKRFLRPLGSYRKHFSRKTDPMFQDEKVAVFGINTARSFTLENGKYRARHLKASEKAFHHIPEGTVRIVVAHHPCVRPPDVKYRALVKGVEKALMSFERSKIDIILSGHFHRHHSTDIRKNYPGIGRSMLHVQAGTACSTRVKQHHPNSYNLLSVSKNRIAIEVREFDGKEFRSQRSVEYILKNSAWELSYKP